MGRRRFIMVKLRKLDINSYFEDLILASENGDSIYHGNSKMIELLIDNGCDVNALDVNNRTALHLGLHLRHYSFLDQSVSICIKVYQM